MRAGFDGWDGFTSSLVRCSEGIVVWDVAVWSGRANFDTGGICYKRLKTSLAVINGKIWNSCQAILLRACISTFQLWYIL